MKIFYDFLFSLINEISQKVKNTTALTITTLAPVGVSSEYEAHIPAKKQHKDRIPEQIITDLNFLHRRIDESAGKMIKAEIRSVPIIRIPITMVSAVSSAMTVL